MIAALKSLSDIILIILVLTASNCLFHSSCSFPDSCYDRWFFKLKYCYFSYHALGLSILFKSFVFPSLLWHYPTRGKGNTASLLPHRVEHCLPSQLSLISKGGEFFAAVQLGWGSQMLTLIYFSGWSWGGLVKPYLSCSEACGIFLDQG